MEGVEDMGKKVHQIVDPETGEVIAEKRTGALTMKYYKALSNGKIRKLLIYIGIACSFLDILFGLVILLVPADWKLYPALLFGLFAILFCVDVRIYNRVSNEPNEDNIQRRKNSNGKD